MKRILIIILILTVANVISAQSDFRGAFVINNEGDTLKGFVDYREGGKNYIICSFRVDKGSEIIDFLPHQIKEYKFIDDKRFISKNISDPDQRGSLIFLEVLIKGDVTLYKYEDEYYVSKDSLFYELKNETSKKLDNGVYKNVDSNEYLGILNYLMSDCSTVSNKLRTTKLYERDLSRLVEVYNKCVGAEFTVYKEKKAWLKLEPGVEISYINSKVDFEAIGQTAYKHLLGSFDNHSTMGVGLFVECFFPRINERLSLYSGLGYSSIEYTSYNEYEQVSYKYRNDVYVGLKQLKIPLGIRYTYFTKRISPFLNIGASATWYLKSSSNWIEEVEANNVVQTSESEAFNMLNNQAGYWAGVGVKKELVPSLLGSFELRYEVTGGITDMEGAIISRVDNIQCIIGLNF